MPSEKLPSTKAVRQRETKDKRAQREHETRLAIIKWFTENEEAPYIALLIAGTTTGILARMFSEYLNLKERQALVLDKQALVEELKFTPEQADKLLAGRFIANPNPMGGAFEALGLPGVGGPKYLTLDLIERQIITGKGDPSQLDDVMGTIGGGIAGFAASVLLLKAIFANNGAQGSGSVLAAGAIVGIGTAAGAAVMGKLAD